jgi:hypothetical protein
MVGGKETEKERVLSLDEIKAFVTAVDDKEAKTTILGEALNACKDEASDTNDQAALTSMLKTILMVRPNRTTKYPVLLSLTRQEGHNDETYDNSNSFGVRALRYVRVCAHGSSGAERQDLSHV